MKQSDLIDGQLFTVSDNKTVLRICCSNSKEIDPIYSIETLREFDNRYNIEFQKTGITIYSFIGGVHVKGFIKYKDMHQANFALPKPMEHEK